MNWNRSVPQLSSNYDIFVDYYNDRIMWDADDDVTYKYDDDRDYYNNDPATNGNWNNDVDDIAQVVRDNWPSNNGSTIERSQVKNVLSAMRDKADLIDQYEKDCAEYLTEKQCEQNRNALYESVGPGSYEQDWLDYLNAMEDKLGDVSIPYQKTIQETVEYETNAQEASGTVQDANLLKVLVIYGYEPVVPLPWLDYLGDDMGLVPERTNTASGGMVEQAQSAWFDAYGGRQNASGDGFGLIQEAARNIRADGRVPLMATAVVRMQSPVEKNDHMLSRDSRYFAQTGSGTANQTTNTPRDNPGGKLPEDDETSDSPSDKAYSREECTVMDKALRNTESEDLVWATGPKSDAATWIYDGKGDSESLIDRGLWPEDKADRTELINDMKSTCSTYTSLTAERDMGNYGGDLESISFEKLSCEERIEASQGTINPSAWFNYDTGYSGGADSGEGSDGPACENAVQLWENVDQTGWSRELNAGSELNCDFPSDAMTTGVVDEGFKVTLYSGRQQPREVIGTHEGPTDFSYTESKNNTVSCVKIERM